MPLNQHTQDTQSSNILNETPQSGNIISDSLRGNNSMRDLFNI